MWLLISSSSPLNRFLPASVLLGPVETWQSHLSVHTRLPALYGYDIYFFLSPSSSLTECSPSNKPTSGTASYEAFLFREPLPVSCPRQGVTSSLDSFCGSHKGWNPSYKLLGGDKLKAERIVLPWFQRNPGLSNLLSLQHSTVTYSVHASESCNWGLNKKDPPYSHSVVSKFIMLYWAAVISSLGCTCPMNYRLDMPGGVSLFHILAGWYAEDGTHRDNIHLQRHSLVSCFLQILKFPQFLKGMPPSGDQALTS